MSDYLLLLKKDIKSMFSIKGRFNKKTDYLGIFISVFLTLAIVAVVVLVYREFLLTYTEIKEYGKWEPLLRLKEIMTVTYTVIIIINVFAGIRKINREILAGSDIVVLVRLPIKPESIFLSKLTTLFISQVLITAVTLIPLTVTVGIVMNGTDLVDTMFWIRSILMVIILPMVSLLMAAALSMATYHIVNFLKSHFVLTAIIIIVLLGAGFVVYSEILGTVGDMLVGEVRDQFFSQGTMKFFNLMYRILYPANLCARFILGDKPWLMLFLILLIAGAALALAFFIVIKILNKVMKAGMEGRGRNTFTKRTKIKHRSGLLNLIKKEFIMVLRTPNYTFQFLATAVTMPVMVFCLIVNFSGFVTNLIGGLANIDFELTITIIMMLSVLTNTFCASNISREGSMFTMEKTMPISYKQIVFSKIIFCSTVSVASILISCIIACVTGYVNVLQALLIFAITAVISVSEIMFATRKDLNKPRFADNEENEIKESTPTISFVIMLGVLVSGLISGVLLILGILKDESFQKLATKAGINVALVQPISIAFIAVVVVLITGVSVIYLLKGLSKRFYNTVN